ncbi:MAG: alpha/beta hydrolase [Pseudomonadota bacterium]
MMAFRQVFARVDGTRLHMRVGGKGPLVVLLHESPRSSAAMLPLATAMAGRATVLALDTPGYGLSDPLEDTAPGIERYGEVVLDLLATLDAPPALLVGRHTGALIAAAAGANSTRSKPLVAGVFGEGFPMFDADERADALANYLPPFEPRWDGTHVAWLWSRIADQFEVFPWYRRSDAARLPYAPPSPAAMHRVAVDIIASGSHYASAYRAAFRAEPHALLAAAGVPICVGARTSDIIGEHMSRLPPDVRAAHLPDSNAGAADAILDAHWSSAGAPTDADTLIVRAAQSTPETRILSHGATTWRLDGEASAPVLNIVDTFTAPSTPAVGEALLSPLQFADDPDEALSDSAYLVAALRASGAHKTVSAQGSAYALAPDAKWTDRWPVAASLVPPDLDPQRDGGHLAAAWWLARDALVHGPFRAPSAGGTGDWDALSAERIHQVFRGLVLAGPSAPRTLWALGRASVAAFKGAVET